MAQDERGGKGWRRKVYVVSALYLLCNVFAPVRRRRLLLLLIIRAGHLALTHLHTL